MTRGALLSALLLACNPTPPAPLATSVDTEPRRGGVLELATAGDIRSLDPASISDGLAPELIELMYAG